MKKLLLLITCIVISLSTQGCQLFDFGGAMDEAFAPFFFHQHGTGELKGDINGYPWTMKCTANDDQTWRWDVWDHKDGLTSYWGYGECEIANHVDMTIIKGGTTMLIIGELIKGDSPSEGYKFIGNMYLTGEINETWPFTLNEVLEN